MRSSERQILSLTPEEALKKLGSVTVGRAVYTYRGLPAVHFVNHVLDHGEVVIRDHGTYIPILSGRDLATALVYETDDIDPATRTGWSVTVSGPARLIEDPDAAASYRDILRPWAAGESDRIISIYPHLVTGYEITAASETYRYQ